MQYEVERSMEVSTGIVMRLEDSRLMPVRGLMKFEGPGVISFVRIEPMVVRKYADDVAVCLGLLPTMRAFAH
jgi:hypothetical protein